MKRISIFCNIIVIVLLILSGCSESGSIASECITLTEDDIFTEFHLHFEGWNDFQDYDIVPYGDGWRLKYSVWQNGPDYRKFIADCIVTDATLKEVSALLAKYNAGKWNSYYQHDNDVYDGSGFTLDVTYPKFSISAEGYPAENFPEGLKDMGDEIKAIFVQYSGKIEF